MLNNGNIHCPKSRKKMSNSLIYNYCMGKKLRSNYDRVKISKVLTEELDSLGSLLLGER